MAALKPGPLTSGRSEGGFVSVVARLMGTNVLALGVAVITGPLAARALGPSGRGDVAAVAAPIALASVALLGGVASFIGRNVARGRSPALLITSMSPVLLVASIIAVVGAIPAADGLAPEGGPVHTGLLVGFLLAPLGLLGRILVSVATFQERWRLTIAMRLMPPAIMLVGIVGLYVSDRLTVGAAITVVLLSTYLPVLPVLPILFGMGRPRLDWSVTREGVSFGSKVWLTLIATQTNGRLDQLLMIALVSRAELGLYAVAVNFSALMGVFVSALVLPLAVRVAKGDRAAAPRAMRRGLFIVLCVDALLAAICPIVLPLAFGSPFRDATLMAVLLLVAAIPSAGSAMLAASLASVNRPGAAAAAQWAALVVTIPALIVLLPALGGEGAALVSIAAYTVTFVFMLRSARRYVGGRYRDYLLVREQDVRWILKTIADALPRRLRISL